MAEPMVSNGIHHASQQPSFVRESSSRATVSPATPVFRSDVFGTTTTNNNNANGGNHNSLLGITANFGRFSLDRATAPSNPPPSSFNDDVFYANSDHRPAPAILIRRLSRHTTDEALKSMLIFAADLIDTKFITSQNPEDTGFLTAVARFRSQSSARDAQQKLDGKPNTSGRATLIVEVGSSGTERTAGLTNSWDQRRSTIDVSASRAPNSATSSSSGSLSGPGSRSRFNSTFQLNEGHSPPLPAPAGNGEFHNPEVGARHHNLLSAPPVLSNGFDDRARITGKSMINDDSADDDTKALLQDPLAYARNGPQVRRPTIPQQQMPIARLEGLRLSTNIESGGPVGSSSLSTPRGHSQISPTSINGGNRYNGYTTNYQQRPQFPPVNPADQNPPCNTLYVGNLPADTSEDELKDLFSHQKGYRRLCFRTKQNGPMCFVEFDDISWASKTLNELYGHVLHNSVKGGIRLSFSKNPLGVRSSQNGGVATNQQQPGSGYTHFAPGSNFSSVSGPPPGLSTPPIASPNGVVSGGANNHYSYVSTPTSASYRGSTAFNGALANPFGTHIPEFAPGGPRGFSMASVQASGNYVHHGHSDYYQSPNFH